MKRTSDKVLIEALRILSREIQSGDGVANAAIAEGAERLEEAIDSLDHITTLATDLIDSLYCMPDMSGVLRYNCQPKSWGIITEMTAFLADSP